MSTVAVSSTPSGADIEIDGVYVGSTPSQVPIATGDRLVRVSKGSYQPFERRLRILPGAKQSVAADLEAEPK